MATMPGRESCVALAASSLMSQVDGLVIALNDGALPPKIAEQSNVRLVPTHSDDRAKFLAAENYPGVFLTVDDDIIYPDGYAELLAARALENPMRPVSLHGSILSPRFEDYYAQDGSRTIVRYFDDCPVDTDVDIIGTGAMAFVPRAIGFSTSWLTSAGLTDIEFSVRLRERDIRPLVVAHPGAWVHPVTVSQRGPSISSASRGGLGGKLDVRAAANHMIRESFFR
jgi:hypothetical protein